MSKGSFEKRDGLGGEPLVDSLACDGLSEALRLGAEGGTGGAQLAEADGGDKLEGIDLAAAFQPVGLSSQQVKGFREEGVSESFDKGGRHAEGS